MSGESEASGQHGPNKKSKTWKKLHHTLWYFGYLIRIFAEFHAKGNSWTTGMETH